MKEVIIVSRCIGNNRFKFNGIYTDTHIKEVIVVADNSIVVGESYVIKGEIFNIDENHTATILATTCRRM